MSGENEVRRQLWKALHSRFRHEGYRSEAGVEDRADLFF